MKTFKVLSNNDDYVLSLPHVRRMAGRTIAQDLVPIQPLGPRTRGCAVISSSMRDFNNWRNETFDRNSIFIITNRDFTHLNGNNNQTTRYRAITTINDCRGYMFDDYILTDRIHDILSSGYDETIVHIHQLVDEVGLTLRQ